MKTTKNENVPENDQATSERERVVVSNSDGPSGLEGVENIADRATTRMVFFGPSEAIDRVRGLRPEDFGEPVNRNEIKKMGVAYAERVKGSKLDQIKEPLVLLINRDEIETLLDLDGCTQLKAMLAVEDDQNKYSPHQTFVLMPCDKDGVVIKSDETQSGVERWKISRNVKSVTQSGSTEYGMEQFLMKELRI